MKILFISLGCDKNLADSEKVIGSLIASGHEITDDENEAEAAVINTCCFIHDAKQESIDTILSTAELKSTACLRYIVIMGCLSERYMDEIAESLPEVDACIGASAYDKVPDVLESLLRRDASENRPILLREDINRLVVPGGRRTLSGLTHYTYLKIAEGCSKHCTYCVIPSVKGEYRSIDFDSLVSEARDIADKGISELVVIAQETTLYGTDIYGRKRLHELLSELAKIDGIKWIRLMYCYPEEIYDELIDVMASEPKICHYIDMPIQHSDSTVLKRMGRRTDHDEIVSIIGKLRDKIPDIAIRTSLITGFPGETEEQHRALVDFVSEMKLDRVGVFVYSAEEGTPAYKLKDRIPKKVSTGRRKELMIAQQKCVMDKNSSLVGTDEDVIVDGFLPEDRVYVGRTFRDAPGVDGSVYFTSERELMSGSIVKVRFEGYNGYDLIGAEIE